MTTITLTARPARSVRTDRRLRRAAAVVAAAAVDAALCGAASALGTDFRLTDAMGSVVISPTIAATATAIFAVLGWATLALLERSTPRRARTVWITLASAVALLSMVPIFLEQATGATRAALTVLHLAVAAVLIPGFRPGRRQPPG